MDNFIGEDDEHIVEIFKAYKRVNAEMKGIEVYYNPTLINKIIK